LSPPQPKITRPRRAKLKDFRETPRAKIDWPKAMSPPEKYIRA
jgi:hypothetical protein